MEEEEDKTNSVEKPQAEDFTVSKSQEEDFKASNASQQEKSSEENGQNDQSPITSKPTAVPAAAPVHPSSKVETASPNDAFKNDQEDQTFHHPLSLNWCFGYNSDLPVHNISEGNRKMIFYVCAHTGVLLDIASNEQCLLQGHNNPISCTAVSSDRRWLATADCGRDCVLIIWDSFSGVPVRTMFDGLGKGTAAVAFSSNSQFLATISADPIQVISVWEWTIESEKPLCQVSLTEDYTYQAYLTFHYDDHYQLVSNSEDLVIFYHWKDEFKYHAHPVLDKDFNKTIGVFSETVFVPGSTIGITGTAEGHGIVWQTVDGEGKEPHIKKGIKLMRMHDSPITVVTSTSEMVVTGDTEGKIKFFDSELKLLNWYEDTMKYGTLCSISFSYSPNLSLIMSAYHSGKSGVDVLGEHYYPSESTKAATPFIIPNFTISTTSASVAHITANGSVVELLLSEHDAAVNALATHPHLPRILISSYSCKVKLWDYETRTVLGSREFSEPNYIQCVCFDPKGEFISIGFTNGTLQVLDAITLEDACNPFRFSRDAVTHIAFSHDSALMATADLDKCVSVYVSQQEENAEAPWYFLAKYRSHYKKIEGLLFGVKLDSQDHRLLSLGSDRTLVEYDLVNSGSDNLHLLSSHRLEQSAIPTAFVWYPPLTKESFFLLVNDQYKIKLYNATTKMCRKTLLGPTYGSPLKKILVLPAPIVKESKSPVELRRYMAYCTKNKVGLLLLPHDGNPHNSRCMMAHPGKVADMTCSFDGKYLFTAGGEDYTVNMWTINTDALEAASHLGGEDLEPFYAMLEGGRDGEFYAELEEYFYYAQIRNRGPNVTTTRHISVNIPTEEIPNVMRAIGFYPSEQEIEDMLNEVKFSKYVDTDTYVTEIDLEDFIRLYINHRPVFGLSPLQIGHAFKTLGNRLEDEKYWSIQKPKLFSLLQEKGEHLTETEVVEYLMTLMGHSDNPEVEGSFVEDTMTALRQIPERISAPMFAEEIIGLSTQ